MREASNCPFVMRDGSIRVCMIAKEECIAEGGTPCDISLEQVVEFEAHLAELKRELTPFDASRFPW